MKLVMFDMDGTLTDSFALDENCYERAIEAALGLTQVVTDWESYTHTSASFCLREIVRRARGSIPTTAELLAVQQKMIELMQAIERQHGRRTQQIPGAAECVNELLERGVAVAIASGDWEATARYKLRSAQIPFENLPAAFCDCADPRTQIMTTALERAQRHYGCARFEQVVYVGDGAWDVRACRELGWPLIGIGEGEPARRLKALGVAQVFDRYTPFSRFFDAVERASVPG